MTTSIESIRNTSMEKEGAIILWINVKHYLRRENKAIKHGIFYIKNISQELHKITYLIKLSNRWPSQEWNNSIANALEPPQPHT